MRATPLLALLTLLAAAAPASAQRVAANSRPAARGPGRNQQPRPGEVERLELPRMTGALFYRPSSGGRQRVFVYLHARNANPRESCQQFHQVVARFGWLLCPLGPVDRGNGRREWRNNAEYARRETIAALDALYARFPRRVRRHDNVVMGFSEGAYVGMNLGLYEPVTFPRWLIFAANDGYIDSETERVQSATPTVRRVYLMTGATDGVVENTRRTNTQLTRAWGRRRVRMQILANSGHQLPLDFVPTVRRALLWVTQ